MVAEAVAVAAVVAVAEAVVAVATVAVDATGATGTASLPHKLRPGLTRAMSGRTSRVPSKRRLFSRMVITIGLLVLPRYIRAAQDQSNEFGNAPEQITKKILGSKALPKKVLVCDFFGPDDRLTELGLK